MATVDNGYIKLFRSLTEWEWYDDTNTVRVWIHLLLKANHKDQRWHGVEIHRGQLITSSERLATELHLSRQQIRRALDNLKSSGEITSKTTNRWTLINIEKYSLFQDWNSNNNQQNNQQKTNKKPTNNQQTTTNNNDKNEKNEKNILPRKRGSYRSSSFEEELDAIINGGADE